MADETYTIGATGSDYTTLSDFVATYAGDKDLVTNAKTITLELKAETFDEDAGAEFTSTDWTTNDTYKFIIKPAAGAEHNGVVGAGPIIAYTAGSNFEAALKLTGVSAQLIGLEFRNNGGTSSKGLVASGNPHIDGVGLIFNDCANGMQYLSTNTTLSSCLALNLSSIAFDSSNFASAVIMNSLAVNCGTGFDGPATSGEMIVQNCCTMGCTNNYTGRCEPTAQPKSLNNAASNGATSTPPGDNPVTSNIPNSDFEDYNNNDFHLSSGSSLIGAGYNLFGMAAPHDVDWEGDARPNAAWDIGPDQYVASGGISITDVANSGETPGSGSESWEDGSSGNVITGSGFV